MNKCFTFLFLLIGFSSFSQETGQVQFQVDVDNGYFEIVINDTMYLKLYKADLPPGHHKAKVWSPGYITTEVEFDIKSGEVTKKYVQMAISNDRQKFEADYKDYRMKFHKSLTVPGTATLALALTSGGFMMAGYNTRKNLVSNIESYHLSPTYSEVVTYKQNINDLNKKYNRQRVFFYSTLGLSAVALGTTIYTYSRFKKNNTEPQLNAPSPFKDKFSLNVGPLGCQIIWRLG